MQNAFAGMVDYAGLFPPAALTMPAAVRNYEQYRRSPDRWMLGRYVVAAKDLEELHETLIDADITPSPLDPWRLTVVIGNDVGVDVERMAAFTSRRRDGNALIDTVECRLHAADDAAPLSRQLPHDVVQYFEVPAETRYDLIVPAIRDAGARAKLRTGGTTPALFPASTAVVGFIQSCVALGLPFKCTAGLHHPFRGNFPLTYDRETERHLMYGFVPLLLATALLAREGDPRIAQAMIEEVGDQPFVGTDAGWSWRDQHFTEADLVAARGFFVGFGSCSFREPIEGLGWEANA